MILLKEGRIDRAPREHGRDRAEDPRGVPAAGRARARRGRRRLEHQGHQSAITICKK